MASDWETGQRRPPAWRRFGVALVVVLVVAGAVYAAVAARDPGGMTVTTGEQVVDQTVPELDVVAREPTDTGDRWLCPQDLPVSAYPDGLAYPRQHPQRPGPAVEPVTCYRDTAAAEADGYALAPPPPDTAVVYGLYLQKSPRALRACGQAAPAFDFAVPCPGLLPHPAGGVSCAGTDATCFLGGGFVMESRDFPVPPGWCDGCDPRITITAARRDDLRARPFATCAGEELPPRLPSRPGRRFEACTTGPPWIPGIGGYPHEGNTLVRWAREGVIYAVSVEGAGPAQYALVSRVANAVVLLAGVEGDRDRSGDR